MPIKTTKIMTAFGVDIRQSSGGTAKQLELLEGQLDSILES